MTALGCREDGARAAPALVQCAVRAVAALATFPADTPKRALIAAGGMRYHAAPARNACQGTSPPSRRQLTLLQGPSRGEEASKKLLAVGSALTAKPRRPQGPRTKAGLQRGMARARSFRRAWSSRCAPLTHIAGLTFQRTGVEVVRVAAALAAPAATDRAQLALRPQVRLPRQSPATDAPHARSSRSLTLNP